MIEGHTERIETMIGQTKRQKPDPEGGCNPSAQSEHSMKEPDIRSRRRFVKLTSILGLAVAFSPRTIAETFAHSKARTTKKENVMTQTAGAEQAADKTAIRPFQFNFTDAE